MSEYIIGISAEVIERAKNGETIRITPTAQEIVRCRDCASFREEDWKCKSFQWRNCYESPDVEPDGFCAWAERRTNDN